MRERGKEVSRMKNVGRAVQLFLFVATRGGAVGGGGAKGPGGTQSGAQRPRVQLPAPPQPGASVYFRVRLQWTGSDSDGRVDYYISAVAPPLEGDTTWT